MLRLVSLTRIFPVREFMALRTLVHVAALQFRNSQYVGTENSSRFYICRLIFASETQGWGLRETGAKSNFCDTCILG